MNTMQQFQFIEDAFAKINTMQNDLNFLQRQREAKERKAAEKKDKAKKAHERANEKAALRREMGLPPDDPKKRVKEVIKARKLKNVQSELRESEKVLPPRVGGPDLEGKVLVRLDSRTSVYAKPGYDIEALRRKYIKRESDIIPIGDNSADKAHRKHEHSYPGEIYNLPQLINLGEK